MLGDLQLMDGIFLINKEKGCSSFDVIRALKRKFSEKKMGHTGTLDPFAEGLLIVCLGKATKAIPFLEDDDKDYLAVLSLGKETDTLDLDGKIINEKEVGNITKDDVENTFKKFLGEITQTPPKYSALKKNGIPLYEYARKNIDVEIPSRKVYISKLELKSFNDNEITFFASVSKGTYIRSLGYDIALALNTVGHLKSLTRTRIGTHCLDESKKIEDLTINDLLPIENFIKYPKVVADEKMVKDIKNGKQLFLPYQGNRILLMNGDEALAIYEYVDNIYKMKRGLF